MTIIRTLALAVVAAGALIHGAERIEGVAAVVGDSIILDSELRAYAFMKASQSGDTLTQEGFARQAPVLLDELIDGKVLLVHAERDTNITVSPREIDRAVDMRIAQMLQQYRLSEEQLAERLRQEQNMSMTKFRSQLRNQVRQEIIKQKVQQLYVSEERVGKSEVEAFYREYRDSLPAAGESVRLSMVRIGIKPSSSVRQDAFDRITSIKERLDNGEDFAELAKSFSEGPNAQAGGDIGFISKGSLGELAFEEKAFSLSPGEVSEPFETRLGFHIVKVVARKDHQIHVKQIFIRVAPSEEEVARVTALLDSVWTHAATREDFVDAVKKYSTDALSRSRDGRLKWQPVNALPSAIRRAIDTLEVGQITTPLREEDAVAIYRVDERVDNRRLTLEDDWNDIEAIARRIVAQQQLVDLVKKWREETFVDVRL
jgi:peptidyl-prolyl cis-trans isomerase SurA